MSTIHDKVLVFRGSNEYDPNKFKDVWGSFAINKPYGGLWTSPLETKHSWLSFCISADMGKNYIDSFFLLKLVNYAKVKTIDSRKDAEDFFEKYADTTVFGSKGERDIVRTLDYSKIVKDYDAIHLTVKGELDSRFSQPLTFYGWDCETVFILKKEVIQLVNLTYEGK